MALNILTVQCSDSTHVVVTFDQNVELLGNALLLSSWTCIPDSYILAVEPTVLALEVSGPTVTVVTTEHTDDQPYTLNLPADIYGTPSGEALVSPLAQVYAGVGVFPVVQLVRAVDENTLDVIFSEPMVPADALEPTNYAINNGVSVVSVAAGPNQLVYRLTTTSMDDESVYQLWGVGIRDLAFNAIQESAMGEGDNTQVAVWGASNILYGYDAFTFDAGNLGVGATATTAARVTVNNNSVAQSIMVLQDNTVEVFAVLDGGAVQMREIAAPATPAANYGRVYVKTDGLIYFKNDAGTEYDLTNTSVAIAVPAATFGSISPAGATSAFDIAVRGNTVYLLSNANALLFAIDVTDPAVPTFLGSIATDATPRALVAQGDFVYVVGDTDPGRNFQVYDVRNPASIVRRNGMSNDVGQSQGMAVQGRLAAAGDRGGALKIFDISNPANPTYIASLAGGFPSQGLAFAGSMLLSADPGSSSLQIWDLSNPAVPTVVSTLGTFTNPRAIRVLDRHAFVMANGDSAVHIVNIAAPATPVLVSSVPTVTSPNCLDLQGDVLYVGGTNGISVHDISNPAAAILVGTIPVTGTVRGIVVVGAFVYAAVSTAPYVQIFRISESYTHIVSAGGVSTGKLDVRGPTTLNEVRVSGGLSVAESLLVSSDLSVGRSLLVAGNLTVKGVTTAVDSTNVLVSDNHLYLNSGYTVNAAQTGGIGVNYLPTATTTTVNGAYVAGVAATSNPTVGTVGAATFAVADLIQISGSTNNDGVYEVLSHAANVLTVRGVGVTAAIEDFSQTQFVAGVSDLATITKVTLSYMRAGTDGVWEMGRGSATPLTFTDVAAGAGTAGRVAYWTGSPATLTSDADFLFTPNGTTVAQIIGDQSATTDLLNLALPNISNVHAFRAGGSTLHSLTSSPVGGVVEAYASLALLGGLGAANGVGWTFYNAAFTNTAIFGLNPNNNSANVWTGSTVERASWGHSTGFVGNDIGEDYDHRWEGDTRSNLLLIDAGLDRVGINRAAGTHGATLDIDNLAVAESIFIARDNGTAVFTVEDGGAVVSTSTNFTIGGAGTMTWPSANASGVLTNNGSGTLTWGAGLAVGAPITSATQGSVLFAGAAGVLAQDNANFFWDDTNNALGIGNTNPGVGNLAQVTLRANRDGAGSSGVFSSFNAVSAATTSTLTIARGRGTNDAPSAVLSGDTIGSLFFAGQTDGTPGNYSSGARLRAVALENFTGSTRGSTLFFDVAGIGGNPAERMSIAATAVIINDSGSDTDVRIEGDTDANLFVTDASTDRVGIGTATPAYKLHAISAGLDHRVVSQTTNTSGIAIVSASTGPSGGPDQQISLVAYGTTIAGTTMGYANADSVALITAAPAYFFVTTPIAGTAPIVFGPQDTETLTLRGTAAGTGLVFNETGIDLDARFESDANANAVYLDAGLFSGGGAVGFGRVPTSNLHGYSAAANYEAMAETASTTGAAYFVAKSATAQSVSAAYGSAVAGNWGFGPAIASSAAVTAAGTATSFIIGATAAIPVVLGAGNIDQIRLNNGSNTTFNTNSVDVDVIFRSMTRPNLLHIDAALDRVGINRGAASAGATLDVDNLAVAESIFIARDNGTAVFTIADGGNITKNNINQSGTSILSSFGAAVTQTGDLFGLDIDLSTNLTVAADSDILGVRVTVPAITQSTAVTTTYRGFELATSGTLEQNTAAGTINWQGMKITMPRQIQTTGTISSIGLWITDTALSDSGTKRGVYVDFDGTQTGGTAVGVDLANITGGGGVEYGIRIGSGWDTDLSFVDTAADILAAGSLTLALGGSTGHDFVVGEVGTAYWKFLDAGNLEMQADYDLLPLNDDDGDIGTAARRFSSGHFRALFAESSVSPQTGASVTVNASDSRTAYTNEGASAEVGFNLPAAAAGLEYTFIVQDTDGVQINAQAGDTIRVGASVSATGGLAESTTIGNVLRLLAINTTEWIAVSVVGTWTVT